MKPDVPRFLGVAAAHLIGRTSPALSDGYEQSTASALGALLMGVIEEFERAAARRIEENAALRVLFGSAVPVVEDETLAARLLAAAAETDADFGVSALESRNAGLRALLIDLHAHVETLATQAAQALENEIWHELAKSTERRRLSMGPF